MPAELRVGFDSVAFLDQALGATVGHPYLHPNDAPSPSSEFWEVIFRYDPLLWFTYHAFTSIFGEFDYFGNPYAGDYKADTISVSSPVTSSLGRDVRFDESNYASQLHSVSSFATFLLKGGFPIPPPSSNEHPCKHATLVGSGILSSQATEPPFQEYGSGFMPVPNGPTAVFHQRTNSVGNFGYYANGQPYLVNFPSFYSFSLKQLMRDLATYSSIGYGNGTQFWRLSGRYFDYHEYGTVFSVTCSSSVTFSGPYFPYAPVTYSWTYTLTADSAVSSGFWLDVGGAQWRIPNRYPVLKFSSVECSQNYNVSYSDTFFQDHVGNGFLFTRGQLYDPSSSGVDVSSRRTSLLALSYDMNRQIKDSWRDIIPSSLFSTVDALQSMDFGTSTDVLQTVVKLPQYKSMIPKIKEAIDIASDILHRDISGETIRDIIKLASGTTLQASFQWRPWMQLITEELPKIVSDWSTLFDDREVVVGRGKFNFDFEPYSFSRPSVHLTVRTKIVLDLSGNSLAAGILGLDGLGIIPKPSNLWDLIPFSFVLNWFTGVGKLIRNAEFSVFLLGLPAYYVHTYTFTSPLTTDELTSLEIVSQPAEPLSLRGYYRHVSVYTPLPRDTRFGFGQPTQLPPSGILGSLLVQLLL